MIDLAQQAARAQAAERWVESHKITRFFTSHTVLAFFYGAFLFLYEVKFLRQLIPVVHPVLIAWAGLLFLYDVLVRCCWNKLPLWKVLALFVVSTVITAVLNFNVSVSGSVKGVILTVLPLVAFYPVCLLVPRQERTRTLLKALLGGAIVVFFASLAAIGLYMMRFGGTVQFMGMESQIGIRLYDPRYADSGIILYGFYEDTNHPAGYAIIFAFYSVALFFSCRKGLFAKTWQNLLGEVFAVANFIVQLCYFPLANSRGGWLSLGVSLFVSAFLYLFCQRLPGRGTAVRAIGSMAAALACVVLVGGCLMGVRGGLSHLSISLEQSWVQAVIPFRPGVSAAFPLLPVDDAQVDSFKKRNEHFGAERIQIWQEAAKLYLNRPVFGEAPGNTLYYTQQYFAEGESMQLIFGKDLHNSYLDLLVDYGAVGFILLMSFFAVCGWTVLQAALRGKRAFGISYFAALGGVLMTACCACLLSCAFINTTAMYFVMLVMISYLMAESGDAPAVRAE